jgi:hypothetical protein
MAFTTLASKTWLLEVERSPMSAYTRLPQEEGLQHQRVSQLLELLDM